MQSEQSNNHQDQNGEERSVLIMKRLFDSGKINEARNIRTQTFFDLAVYMKFEPYELHDILLEHFTYSTDDLLAYYEQHPPGDLHKTVLEQVQKSDDLWLRMDVQELYIKMTTIQQFTDFYDGIQTHISNYIGKLVTVLPYPLSEVSTMDDLHDLLLQIPFVYTFEMDFNAFLASNLNYPHLPLIRMNYLLFTVIDVFVETVVVIMAKTDDHYKHLELFQMEEIRERSKISEYCFSLISCIEMIFGNTPAIARLKLEKDESNTIYYDFVTPVLPFIEFHEIGHLLLGHLELPYDKELEYEADEFAMIYINGLIYKFGSSVTFRVFISIAAFFVLLYCREIKVAAANADQYPTAMERFLKIGSRFNLETRRKIAKAWNNVVMATDWTFKKAYNIKVPFCDVE